MVAPLASRQELSVSTPTCSRAQHSAKSLAPRDTHRERITPLEGSVRNCRHRAGIAEDTLSPLSDPIHEELWDDKGFHFVIQKSFRKVSSKEQIRREVYDDHPKAIWVPADESGILPAKAFFAIARLRHVQVEAGYHTIERQAWRYCHTLTIVKLSVSSHPKVSKPKLLASSSTK